MSHERSSRPSALDFATHNLHGDPLSEHERAECASVIHDMAEEFGAQYVADLAMSASSIRPADHANPSRLVIDALRRFCVIIAESDHPKLDALLVAKLVRLHVTSPTVTDSLNTIGAKYGISKQAVSKRMSSFALQLGLPRPDSTPENRNSHRLMNRRNYGFKPIQPRPGSK